MPVDGGGGNQRQRIPIENVNGLPCKSRNPFGRSMDDLPTIILHDILSRLSVRMLVRSRRVCKSWLSIIDDPYFRKNLRLEESTILGCSDGDKETGPIMYMIRIEGGELKARPIANFPELVGFRHKCSGGMRSCNGFVLLGRRVRSRIIESAIVNPSTKEVVRVPGSPYQPGLFDNLALGFDPMTKTYKLVQLLVRDTLRNELGAAIFDFKNKCWRYSHGPRQFVSSNGIFKQRTKTAGAYVCGTLNWISSEPNRRSIISFDVGNESFRKLSTPGDMDKRYRRVDLIDVAGSLALCDLSLSFWLVIWVLRDGGSQGWSRQFSIRLDGPLCLTNRILGTYSCHDKVILAGSFWTDRCFVVHDLNNQSFKCCIQNGLPCAVDLYCAPWNLARLCDPAA
ncbi:hypothetical protein MLD38_006515 [Melastoma candidum]|uniref:Uncharacterized protein n=1 Tax=Melastoma candidum TaxID=119954 RepID=A0ACB9RMP6_9MYRT|nr:hypothetical protein MLD38_006515 [Melastoma candidum]